MTTVQLKANGLSLVGAPRQKYAKSMFCVVVAELFTSQVPSLLLGREMSAHLSPRQRLRGSFAQL